MTPSGTFAFPIDEVRSRFPALERLHNGHAVAYFDGPGGTQVPRDVAERMADYLYDHNANTHWGYPTSDETDAIIQDARAAFAAFFNAGPSEVVFGQNMTTLTFHLARTLGRKMKAGDQIIVTELDHHANVDTWRSLEKERGVEILRLPMDPETGKLRTEELSGLITDRTRLVAVGAASNAIGTITDVASICRAARDAGALSFVDAVHFAPHFLPDVKAIGCDFLACSAYKFYGPHIGILFCREELLASLDFPKLAPAPDIAPECAETGTLNHEGIAGAAAAVEFLAGFGSGDSLRQRLADSFARFHEHEHPLAVRLRSGLAAIGGVKIFGPDDEHRSPLVSFTVLNQPSAAVSRALAKAGIFASHGDFYAATVVKLLGVSEQGLLRAGCSIYTTETEIDRLLEGISVMVKRGSALGGGTD
ncbi:MAG TPA: cysteine desulfurase-like protein [Pyrinomonadaceae bacterium]|nr:cysteine desulfurase-like protein [Pyrinomonadaceae bacterium]